MRDLRCGREAAARREPQREDGVARGAGQGVPRPVLPQHRDTGRVAGGHQHAGAHVALGTAGGVGLREMRLHVFLQCNNVSTYRVALLT